MRCSSWRPGSMRWPDITVTATRPGLFKPGSAPLTADNAPRIGMLARRIAVGSSALEELVGDVEPRAAAKLQRVTLRHNEAWLRALQQVSVLNLSVTCSLFWSAGWRCQLEVAPA